MSSHAEIAVLIQQFETLLKSFTDLNAEYRKLAQMKVCGKIEKVDVAVKNPATGREIGFQKTENGGYRIICDSEGLSTTQEKQQQDFVKQIRRRYSYNKVLEELQKQGYIIAEEEKLANNTVRLVARKWS